MRTRRRLAILASTAVVVLGAGLLTGCGPTPAGTVDVRQLPLGEGVVVQFIAAGGKNNNVTVTIENNGAVRVTETGGITVGSGCTRVDANSARCPVGSGPARVDLDLRDGNDTGLSSIATLTTVMHGGSGEDTLTGGGAIDVLTGDEGTDTLNGGGGNDSLFEGDTAAETDVVDADRFNGGPGRDAVGYIRATTPLSIDIDGVADDGQPVEGDNVNTDVERLFGGEGQDSLTGDGDDNDIRGEKGPDAIRGGGGNDSLLAGGDGDDVVLGEDGNDNLQGGAGTDILSGGPGTDLCSGEFETECES